MQATPGLSSRLKLLEAWVESSLAYRDQPGLSLGIVRDQELIWERGFGLADTDAGRVADADTLYRIASISKLFTAIAVMQLRDEGRVRVDEPIQSYLPWFSVRGRAPDWPETTLWQLLTHTSGLPREAAFPYWNENDFPDADQIRKTVPEQELVHPPETRWKYSNLAYALAGMVVEAVSGRSYSDWVAARICAPLEMTSTTVEVGGDRRDRLAVGYGRRMPGNVREVRPFSDTRAIGAAGGVVSSVRDLARFASFLFHPAGKGVLRPATIREMQRVHWARPDWQGGWGLGFSLVRRGERTLVGHGGWLAGYQSSLTTSPLDKIAVIALGNADDAAPYPGRAESVVDRVWSWVAPAMRPLPAPPPPPEPIWARYVGLYRSAWGDRQILELDGRLTMIAPTELDPFPLRVTLDPVGEHRFRTRSDAPFGEDGDPVVFEFGADGEVARLRVGESYSLPVRTG